MAPCVLRQFLQGGRVFDRREVVDAPPAEQAHLRPFCRAVHHGRVLAAGIFSLELKGGIQEIVPGLHEHFNAALQ